MTRETPKDLQIVLNEMFASAEDLSLADVRVFQGKYPEYKRELAEAYADWREFEFFVLADEDAAAIDREVSEREKKTIENALAQFRAESAEAITNLRELAEKRGVAREELPEKLGVSETLVRKIERRNLKEIPRWLEEKLGEIFRVPAESWRTFFDLPATLSPAARYKSKNAPQTQPKQSFAEAVKNDPELSDDEKRELLSRK